MVDWVCGSLIPRLHLMTLLRRLGSKRISTAQTRAPNDVIFARWQRPYWDALASLFNSGRKRRRVVHLFYSLWCKHIQASCDCSPLGLELMVKLRTLLTVFTFILKAKALMERGVKFPTRLMVFGQSQCTVLVGQSEQTALVGRRDFVENEAFERGGA